MSRFTLAISIFVGTFFLIGCGNDKPTFSLLPTSYTYTGSESIGVEVNNKVDVLWVIDNSGSMHSSQVNLANNFNSFINNFMDKGYDFQIAVTTTEAYDAAFTSNPGLAQFRDGQGSNHSGVFVITPETPNLVDTFVTNIMQGTSGNPDERAFQSFREALNSNLNAGFIREDSFLSVVIVSDEDDFSWDGSNSHAYNYNNELHTISEYTDFLDQITGSTSGQKNYSVNGIFVHDQDCSDQISRPIGIRYKEMVEATEGVMGSICDSSFSLSLDTISKAIITQVASIPLEQIPVVETLVVTVDGQVSTHWTYDPLSNNIVFDENHEPAQGAILNVTFDPATF